MALTIHCYAGDADKVFSTYNASGVHTGTPANDGAIAVWDDEGDGGVDVAWSAPVGSLSPQWRITPTTMAHPSILFAGDTSRRFSLWNQTGTVQKNWGNLLSASAKTIIFAIQPWQIPNTSVNAWQRDAIFAEDGAWSNLHLWSDSGTTKVGFYNFSGAAQVVALP